MAKPPLQTLETLIDGIRSYFPDANLDLVRQAYHFADQAHKGQVRSSGEPYITHPTEVASLLVDLKLDLASIIAALLHDTVEDTSTTLEQIEAPFGKDVSELVDGVTKLSKITFKTTEEKQAENFRKMILAMAKDIRVILVKLADRLNNMRTLEHLAPHKQQAIAQETLDIYAPIANRLGISKFKIELEDLCLRYLHADVYYKLADKVSMKKNEREQYIEDVCEQINERLKEYEIQGTILGRAKHFYSIFKKMDRRKVDFEQINDVIAFRILVDNITECYKSLGVIHAAYMPVPGRFKDYIAMPKANAYQSLHTTVIGPNGERIEIQIRTNEMHQVAEKGIAAHWKYKEGHFSNANGKENVGWVNRLLEWHKDLKDPNEFLETVKIDLFAEDVFVFTPLGEVKELPHGATPLDFAYAVHTDVGHKCVGAKVNGKIVPLKYRLKSGDTVEIITSPTPSPSKDWLKIVRSSRAKAKIRGFIKLQERVRAKELGYELLDKTLRSYNVNLNRLEKSDDVNKLVQNFKLRTFEELVICVGYGRIQVDDIVPLVVPKEAIEQRLAAAKAGDETFLKKMLGATKKRNESRATIKVANLEDVLIRFGKCCNPLPGDSIMGFITRGRGVTIHTASCPKAIDNDTERKIDVQWNIAQSAVKRHVRIRVLTLDEPGLLAVMSQAINAHSVNIASANIRTTKDKKAICFFDIEVSDVGQLQKVISSLEGKKGVISVERTRS